MVKNRKYAIICAYNGTNYHGCQINNQVKTIETTLLDILDELNLLPQQTNEENSEELKEEEINEEELSEEKENSVKEINIFKKYNINKIGLQRSSRTDKGVHSSFNTFVIKSPVDLTTKKIEIQQNLPEDIYIYKILRVTKGFVAQKRCESRVYHYYIKKDLFTYKRKERDIKKVVEALILNYLGYKNYFNFTNLRNKKDTKRYIRRISLTEENGYFLIELEGNSFLYNQIRKMMGYLVQVVRDGLSIFEKEFVSIDTNLPDKDHENSTLIDLINRSFNKCFTNQMEILKAPGEFLILYYQGYKNYNEKHSTLHGKIEVDKNELNEVTDKLIKSKMFVEENDKIFYECVDKFEELRNKNIEINN